MGAEFRTHRHSQGWFTIPVPADWHVTEQVPQTALVAAEPEPDPRRFPPNAVVTVEQLAQGETLQAWAQRSEQALADSGLPRLRVIDLADTEVGGLPARRTLWLYLHDVHGGVNLDQWQVARHGWGYVVSCSMGALDYDALTDALCHMAEGLELELEGPGS